LVTPALGTPASGNLANCTFPTLNQDTTGTATNAVNLTGSGTVSATATGGAGLTPTNATNATGSAVVTGEISSSSPTAGIGYAAGAGGTVTQATSATTDVTLNKVVGSVLWFGGSLTSGTIYSFFINNSTVLASDIVVGAYNFGADGSEWSLAAAGAGKIRVRFKAGATGAYPTELIYFAILRAVQA